MGALAGWCGEVRLHGVDLDFEDQAVLSALDGLQELVALDSHLVQLRAQLEDVGALAAQQRLQHRDLSEHVRDMRVLLEGRWERAGVQGVGGGRSAVRLVLIGETRVQTGERGHGGGRAVVKVDLAQRCAPDGAAGGVGAAPRAGVVLKDSVVTREPVRTWNWGQEMGAWVVR